MGFVLPKTLDIIRGFYIFAVNINNMTAFFKAIEDLFVNFLFLPFDAIRSLENWWGANTLNWVFLIIGFAGMVYWMLQLKDFDQKGQEDKTISAHSFL